MGWGLGGPQAALDIRGPDLPVREGQTHLLFEEDDQDEDDSNPSSFVWPRTREGRPPWPHSEAGSHQPCPDPPQSPPSPS